MEFMVDIRLKTLNYQTILYKLYRNKCSKGTELILKLNGKIIFRLTGRDLMLNTFKTGIYVYIIVDLFCENGFLGALWHRRRGLSLRCETE